jgi:hypothetical protein
MRSFASLRMTKTKREGLGNVEIQGRAQRTDAEWPWSIRAMHVEKQIPRNAPRNDNFVLCSRRMTNCFNAFSRLVKSYQQFSCTQ